VVSSTLVKGRKEGRKKGRKGRRKEKERKKVTTSKRKGKVIPLQARCGPEGG